MLILGIESSCDETGRKQKMGSIFCCEIPCGNFKEESLAKKRPESSFVYGAREIYADTWN